MFYKVKMSSDLPCYTGDCKVTLTLRLSMAWIG
uniref:Uncharacterized protein n=1 Tax=Anguilla anguilla TaxID=7936 RepID=A0A0E9V8E1_ANGAN